MTWVYIQSEPRLWTVGFYNARGEWRPETDWPSPTEAAARVHYLNGGGAAPGVTKMRPPCEPTHSIGGTMADEPRYHPPQYDDRGRKIEYGTVDCSCGCRVPLTDSFANDCPQCGTEYNRSGHRLAPRRFWGEETGERF